MPSREQDQQRGARQLKAVILTAIPEEFSAVITALDDVVQKTHPQGTVFHCGCFAAEGANWDVAVAQIGAGTTGAAGETERAVAFFRPHVLMFVGCAGGLKDVRIGDVVVGEHVYNYHSGKAANGFEPRPRVHVSTYRMLQRAKAEAHNPSWRNRIPLEYREPEPKVYVAPIAAGDQVISSTHSDSYCLLKSTYGDALAVDMETSGFLDTAHMNDVDALVVRGISDLIDDKARADGLGSQVMASHRAAAFGFQILEALGNDKHYGRRQADDTTAVEFEIKFSGDLTIDDLSRINSVLHSLREICGQPLKVKRLEGGSLVARLLTSVEGFSRIQALHEAGFLEEILQQHIETLSVVGADESLPRDVAATHADIGRTLLMVLSKCSSPTERRVVDAIGKAGGSVFSRLCEGLSDPDIQIRKAAAHALGQTRTPEGVAALVSLLERGDPRTAAEAIRALGGMGGPGVGALQHARQILKARVLDELESEIAKAMSNAGMSLPVTDVVLSAERTLDNWSADALAAAWANPSTAVKKLAARAVKELPQPVQKKDFLENLAARGTAAALKANPQEEAELEELKISLRRAIQQQLTPHECVTLAVGEMLESGFDQELVEILGVEDRTDEIERHLHDIATKEAELKEWRHRRSKAKARLKRLAKEFLD